MRTQEMIALFALGWAIAGWTGCNRQPPSSDTAQQQDRDSNSVDSAIDDPVARDDAPESGHATGDTDAAANTDAAGREEVADTQRSEGDVDDPSDGQPPEAGQPRDPTERSDDVRAGMAGADGAERVLLLSPAGPIVVDFVVTAAGQVIRESAPDALQRATMLADNDRDGRPTWSELVENELFQGGQLGNDAITDENRGSIPTGFDLNRDGRVDPLELRRFLSRGMGGSGGVKFTAANYYRDTNRTDSVLFGLLDQDRDGRLSVDECHRATSVVIAHDQDADNSLTMPEISPPEAEMPDPLTGQRRFGTDTAVALDRYSQWDELLFVFDNAYRQGRRLQATDFPLTPELFSTIDQNDDGRWDASELSRLQSMEPHLTVRIDFEMSDEPDPATGSTGAAAIEIAMAPELRETTWQSIGSGGAIELRLKEDRVLLFAADRRMEANPAARLLASLDANNNGYLEGDETTGTVGLPNLIMLDLDGDEQVEMDELRLYFDVLAGVAASQLRLQVGDQVDALFAYCDINHDGQLGGREIELSAERLVAMDVNQDGQVDWQEIPHALLVGVGRGAVLTINDLSRVTINPGDAALPTWFSNMDVNRDGEIGLAEFLGDEALFQSLDQDGDGYVEADEVSSD